MENAIKKLSDDCLKEFENFVADFLAQPIKPKDSNDLGLNPVIDTATIWRKSEDINNKLHTELFSHRFMNFTDDDKNSTYQSFLAALKSATDNAQKERNSKYQ